MAECPSTADLKAFGKQRAEAEGVPWPMIERQFQQESGWRHCRDDGTLVRSGSNAIGVAQIIQRWHPEVDVTDPWASLTYAIHWMRTLRDLFGSWKFALMAYNWGPQSVKIWQAAGADDAQIRGETRHYLDVILGPGWPEPTGDSTVDDGAATMTIFEDYRDPQPAGTFAATPNGIILHGSRSGVPGNPKDKEYQATARYEVSNPNDLGWNATIGEGKVAVHLDPREWGWNARAASETYLGVEFAQATADEPITDPQVTAFVDWVKARVLPIWPNLPLVFPSHAEIDRDVLKSDQGKSDVFAYGSPKMTELRARIMAGLRGGGVVSVPDQATYAVGPGILSEMARHGDVPACDELFFKQDTRDEWSEAFGKSGARYIWLPSVGRVFRYDPAA